MSMSNFFFPSAAMLALLLFSIQHVSGDNLLSSIGGPVERLLQLNSNVTILDEGKIYIINEKFDGKAFFGRNVSMVLESGAEIIAPEDWAAIRVVTASTFKMLGGSVQGWYGKPAVQLHNGQSSDDTASFAEIYDGSIVGGQGEGGGVALDIHGFGTQAKIYGGEFFGGIGEDGVIDGLSINVQNFAQAHIYSGTFRGDMEIGTGSTISFYGCFLQDGTKITGRFVDETELNIAVKTKNGGKLLLIASSEQECDTAPSMSPTNFPTVSPQPTPKINDGERKRTAVVLLLTLLMSGILFRS